MQEAKREHGEMGAVLTRADGIRWKQRRRGRQVAKHLARGGDLLAFAGAWCVSPAACSDPATAVRSLSAPACPELLCQRPVPEWKLKPLSLIQCTAMQSQCPMRGWCRRMSGKWKGISEVKEHRAKAD